MTSSASIAHHLAMVIMGIIYAAVLAVLTGSLWPGVGLIVFVLFLVAWGLGIVNTVAIERRHPELILPSTWTYIKVRYKPWQLSQKEYQITLGEFVRGQIELIVYGAPLGLLVGGWACGNIMAARKMAGVSDCFWGVDCSHGRRHRLCDSKAIARRAHALNGTTRKLSGRIDYRRILVAAKDLTDR